MRTQEIRTGETVAEYRTVKFRYVNVNDGLGINTMIADKAKLSYGVSASAGVSTNSFAFVEDGWYKVELTLGEVTKSVGSKLLVWYPGFSGEGFIEPTEVTFVSAKSYDEPETKETIAAEVIEDLPAYPTPPSAGTIATAVAGAITIPTPPSLNSIKDAVVRLIKDASINSAGDTLSIPFSTGTETFSITRRERDTAIEDFS